MSRSDQILKEILREERDKQRNNREKQTIRSHSEPRSERSNRGNNEREVHPNDNNTKQKFMFLYEDGERLYRNLNSVEKTENKEIIIHPVYIAGHTENINSEVVVYQNGKWKHLEENENSSWLDIIYRKHSANEYEILSYDFPEILTLDGIYYHCIDDLTEYFQRYGAHTSEISD